MEEAILQEVDALREDLIEAVGRLVAVRSIRTKKEPKAPYGNGVKEALETALQTARDLGFKTKSLQHHIGYAYDRKGDQYVGVFGHVDVVEAAGTWLYPPFNMTRTNGRLYGRGVLDNKGPVMASLFALKALKNARVSLGKPVRIVFGCDEESQMQDIAVYLRHEKLPESGFTPDCRFPVVYSERGKCLFEISGSAEALMRFLNQYILGSHDIAKRMGIDWEVPEYGRVEILQPVLFMKQHKPYLKAEIFYPYGLTLREIETKLIGLLEAGLTYKRQAHYPPVYHGQEEPMIQALKRAYEYVTRKTGTPLTSQGGTYALAVNTIVPFGPVFPESEIRFHQTDEWLSEDELIMICKIYALAIYYLAK